MGNIEKIDQTQDYINNESIDPARIPWDRQVRNHCSESI